MAKKTNDKMVKEGGDGLTKDQRRNRNLKLKADAKQRAFDEKLNWFDDIPAAAFHQNFDKAFADATTHPKAIELLVDPSAPASTAPKVEEPKTVEQKANEAAERFEERTKTAAELTVEAAKAALVSTVANDNTEQVDEPATETPVEEPVVVPATEESEQPATEVPTETPADTTGTADVQANEFDENGKLIRWEGESSKLYGRRAHKAKLAKAWVKPEAVEETRNGEPPVAEKSYPEGKLDYHSDHDGQSVQPPVKTPAEINKTLPIEAPVEMPEAIADPMLKLPTETKKVWKARIKLLNTVKIEMPQETAEPTKSALESANVFEAAEMAEETTATDVPDATSEGTEEAPTTEEPVVETPVEEAPNNAPEEVQEPVQTEPVSKPVETGPSEAKTDKKPTLTLVSNNPHVATYAEPAKKFYGSAWTDERAPKLTEAYRFLAMAIRAEDENKQSTINMAMKQALRFEAEAFAVAVAMAA